MFLKRAVPNIVLIVCLTAAAPLLSAAQVPASVITSVTIIDVVPDYAMSQNVAASTAILARLADETRNAAGVISFKVLQDASRSNHFVLLGVWKDMHAFENYTGAESTKQFRQSFQSRQAGPFDERVYFDLATVPLK